MNEYKVRNQFNFHPVLTGLRCPVKGESVSRRKPIMTGTVESVAEYLDTWVRTYLQLAEAQRLLLPRWIQVVDNFVDVASDDIELLVMDVLKVQYLKEQESRMHCFLSAFRVSDSEFRLGGESLEDLVRAFLKERKCFLKMEPW